MLLGETDLVLLLLPGCLGDMTAYFSQEAWGIWILARVSSPGMWDMVQ